MRCGDWLDVKSAVARRLRALCHTQRPSTFSAGRQLLRLFWKRRRHGDTAQIEEARRHRTERPQFQARLLVYVVSLVGRMRTHYVCQQLCSDFCSFPSLPTDSFLAPRRLASTPRFCFFVCRARARQALVATTLGVLALAAIIVARQSVGYRRGSSTDVVLDQASDPFMQELSAMHATPKVQEQVMAQRSKAEQLLVKARTEMKERGPEIDALLKHSDALRVRLAEQEAAEKKMGDRVAYAQKNVDELKAKDAELHMTTKYPSFDEASSLSDTDADMDTGFDAAAIAAAGKAIAKAYAEQQGQTAGAAAFTEDDEGGPLVSRDMDNGVDAAAVKAAARAIAQQYASKNIEAGSAEDWDGDSLRKSRAQRVTSRQVVKV